MLWAAGLRIFLFFYEYIKAETIRAGNNISVWPSVLLELTGKGSQPRPSLGTHNGILRHRLTLAQPVVIGM
jgi:hypothetical protein